MRRNRCLWREEQYMFHLLRQTLSPRACLRDSVENWHGISTFLRENPRKRELQMMKLAGMLS